ncbi:MAG: nitroreductase family protein [Terracidiphilus sp.]
MNDILDAIFQRRAVKVFEPVEISDELREQILNAARHAPSSFNSQPYKFYWVQSVAKTRGGETMPRAEARGDRLRTGRGGCRSRIAVCHLARPAGVDA